jgi:cytochrome c peroxidase
VPIPQFGFGRNGFGVDYGRYNATFDPGDLMKFRTPPLLNVEKTAPYGHSGSLGKIQDVIVAHFDPLRYIDSQDIEPYARHEFARQISRADSVEIVSYLNDEEIEQVTEFLKSLSF